MKQDEVQTQGAERRDMPQPLPSDRTDEPADHGTTPAAARHAPVFESVEQFLDANTEPAEDEE